MISKEIKQGLYKAGPEFPFETLMTFKEGWKFSQFCSEKTWVFSSFELLNFWPAEFSQFFYCDYLGSNIYLGKSGRFTSCLPNCLTPTAQCVQLTCFVAGDFCQYWNLKSQITGNFDILIMVSKSKQKKLNGKNRFT